MNKNGKFDYEIENDNQVSYEFYLDKVNNNGYKYAVLKSRDKTTKIENDAYLTELDKNNFSTQKRLDGRWIYEIINNLDIFDRANWTDKQLKNKELYFSVSSLTGEIESTFIKNNADLFIDKDGYAHYKYKLSVLTNDYTMIPTHSIYNFTIQDLKFMKSCKINGVI